MKIHIFSTGSEITAGKSIDTNSAWIASQLFDLGYSITRFVVLPDDPVGIKKEILSVMEQDEINLILMTGGLGATADDYTLQVITEITNRQSVTDHKALEKLKAFSRLRGQSFRDILPMAQRQTFVPEGSYILTNDTGIAPGFFIALNQTTKLAAFPGVPKEMKKMFQEQFLPVLLKECKAEERFASFCCIWGMSESLFQETFVKSNQELIQKGIDWGVTAKSGYIKFTFRSLDKNLVEDLSNRIYNEYEDQIGNDVFSDIHQKLTKDNKTLATAESCTGGLVAKKITDIPGSSLYFLGSVVAYHNEIKTKLLQVKPKTLEKFGAVSKETAIEMAEGLENLFQTDFSLSITGIAGPGGGTEDKKVGLVFVGVKKKGENTEVKQFQLPLGRELFRDSLSNLALFLLYKKLFL
ncbi:MAG: nicotinamide-nucleotide amidohydrolase family protein [Leptospiraceae bacterium]|nr:nicotinamide-nucleotide amidohydrolase family protein [Leptospiraceae bacterium]MCP5495251.1 nicotinamide-nucleotide amidohydrolase family protein [Leptospiraceae bacterium]